MGTTTWVISDPHFHHANILESGKIGLRPFADLDAMHRAIIGGVNRFVEPHHKLYVLGDITLQRRALSRWLEIVREWRGHKRLIRGNHDHGTEADYLAAGFEKVLAYRELGGAILSHIPVHPSQFYRYIGNIHGHVHANSVKQPATWAYGKGLVERPDPRYINACVENTNYTPLLLNDCLEHFRSL